MKALPFSRGAWAWALYDWANSAFILSVVTVFYGRVFKAYWFPADGEALFWQGVSVTGSSILIAIAAPFLGSIADGGPVKKRWLLRFALLGSLSTLGLALLPAGAWVAALFLRFTASLGFFGSLVFYDALLTDVSTPRNRHVVSGLGFSIGYLGSVLLLLGQYALILDPGLLGLSSPLAATKVAFISVALWWIAFTLPLLRWVKEIDPRQAPPLGDALRHGGRHLWENFRSLLGHRLAAFFLLGYFFYIDGVNTFMQMVGAFTAELGIAETDLIQAIILVQIIGVPCAVLVGWLGQRFHPKPLLLGCLAVYFGVSLFAWRLSGEPVRVGPFEIGEIYILGFLIGIVQGGLQSLSRSTFANLIPDHKAAAYFGFFNMLGKGGAILGPLLMSSVGSLAGDARWGALAISGLFLTGAVLLIANPLRKAAST
jgi:MFS transporter, UMF1 family